MSIDISTKHSLFSSHTPSPTLHEHAVPNGSNPSSGQPTELPSQTSSTSQTPDGAELFFGKDENLETKRIYFPGVFIASQPEKG